MGRKITELSKDELLALDAMFESVGAAAVTDEPAAEERVHWCQDFEKWSNARLRGATRAAPNCRHSPSWSTISIMAPSDVAAATKAIVADADNRATGSWERVYVTSGIQDAVVAALRSAYPRRFIIVPDDRWIDLRHAPVLEAAEDAGPPSAAERVDKDAVALAAQRIAALSRQWCIVAERPSSDQYW
jgi:hypothetical protein